MKVLGSPREPTGPLANQRVGLKQVLIWINKNAHTTIIVERSYEPHQNKGSFCSPFKAVGLESSGTSIVPLSFSLSLSLDINMLFLFSKAYNVIVFKNTR